MLVSTLNTHKTKNTVSFLLTATKNMHVEKANELLCPPAISNTLHNPSINDAMIASTRQILHCTKAKYFKINFCSEPSSEKEWMAWCIAYLCRRARSNLFTMWKWENIDPNGRTRSRVYRIRWYTTFSRIRANAILKKNRTKQRSELTIYAERSNFVFFLLLLLHTFPLSRVCRVRWNQQWLFSIYQICSTFRWHSTLVHFVVVFFFCRCFAHLNSFSPLWHWCGGWMARMVRMVAYANLYLTNKRVVLSTQFATASQKHFFIFILINSIICVRFFFLFCWWYLFLLPGFFNHLDDGIQ